MKDRFENNKQKSRSSRSNEAQLSKKLIGLTIEKVSTMLQEYVADDAEQLDLSRNFIGSKKYFWFLSVFSQIKANIKSLNLQYNGLHQRHNERRNDGKAAITYDKRPAFYSMSKNLPKTVTKLNIGNNGIGLLEAPCLDECFNLLFCSLTHVNLENNSFDLKTPEELKSIFGILADENSSLTSIDLSGNNLSDAHLRALFSLLSASKITEVIFTDTDRNNWDESTTSELTVILASNDAKMARQAQFWCMLSPKSVDTNRISSELYTSCSRDTIPEEGLKLSTSKASSDLYAACSEDTRIKGSRKNYGFWSHSAAHLTNEIPEDTHILDLPAITPSPSFTPDFISLSTVTFDFGDSGHLDDSFFDEQFSLTPR